MFYPRVIASAQSSLSEHRSTIRSISDDNSRHVLIDRDDDIYQAYVNVALTNSGKLVCVWRETAVHAAGTWSRLVMRNNSDLGKTWSQRMILDDGDKINWLLSNLVHLKDGRLVINAVTIEGDGYLFWNEDDRERWSGPQPTGTKVIGPRRSVELHNGTLLQPLHQQLPKINH